MNVTKVLAYNISKAITESLNEMSMLSMTTFKDYDAIDLFSDEYYIVSKDGKFNLVDRKGKLISDKWFTSIEKKGGEIEVKTKNTKNGQDVTLSKDEVSSKTIGVIGLLDDIKLPKGLTFSDIIYIEPYALKIGKNETIQVIAKVLYNGVELLIDNNGELFNNDGSVYVVDKKNYAEDNKLVKSYLNAYADVLYTDNIAKYLLDEFGVDLCISNCAEFDSIYVEYYPTKEDCLQLYNDCLDITKDLYVVDGQLALDAKGEQTIKIEFYTHNPKGYDTIGKLYDLMAKNFQVSRLYDYSDTDTIYQQDKYIDFCIYVDDMLTDNKRLIKLLKNFIDCNQLPFE